MLAMYDFALTPAQVDTNYKARLPDSPPSVQSFAATVHEDGMAHAAKKEPGLYASGLPAGSLEWVALDAADQDEDPNYVNFNAADTFTKPMKVFLASVPPLAQLYSYLGPFDKTLAPFDEVEPTWTDAQGADYTTAQAEVLGRQTVKSYRVRVRPAKSLYSDRVNLA